MKADGSDTWISKFLNQVPHQTSRAISYQGNQLVRAAKSGDISKLTDILDSGVNINSRSSVRLQSLQFLEQFGVYTDSWIAFIATDWSIWSGAIRIAQHQKCMRCLNAAFSNFFIVARQLCHSQCRPIWTTGSNEAACRKGRRYVQQRGSWRCSLEKYVFDLLNLMLHILYKLVYTGNAADLICMPYYRNCSKSEQRFVWLSITTSFKSRSTSSKMVPIRTQLWRRSVRLNMLCWSSVQ